MVFHLASWTETGNPPIILNVSVCRALLNEDRVESLSELGAPVVHQTNKLKSDTQIFFSSGQYCRPTICWQNAIITISCNKIVSLFFCGTHQSGTHQSVSGWCFGKKSYLWCDGHVIICYTVNCWGVLGEKKTILLHKIPLITYQPYFFFTELPILILVS